MEKTGRKDNELAVCVWGVDVGWPLDWGQGWAVGVSRRGPAHPAPASLQSPGSAVSVIP